MIFFKKILNFFSEEKKNNDIKYLTNYLNEIKKSCFFVSFLSNEQLRHKTQEFKTKIKNKNKKLLNKLHKLKKDINIDNNKYNKNIYNEIKNVKIKIYKQEQNILNKILPEAFAVVKEISKRFKNNDNIIVNATKLDEKISKYRNYVNIIDKNKSMWQTKWVIDDKVVKWNMAHYYVQIMGGIVLHQGKIAEMATGEGKTLVATLPIYLNALSGRGVHVVTVNDYLSKRDSSWMAPIMEFLGLTVDCIDYYKPLSYNRKQAYYADITYGTNSEFGFDYLRDNMTENKKEIVQRELNYAIIDEIDSVLIDEARTPLIISGVSNYQYVNSKSELKILNKSIKELIKQQELVLNEIINQVKKLIIKKNKEKIGFNLLKLNRGLPRYQPLIKLLNQKDIRDLFDKTEIEYLQDNEKSMYKIDKDLFFTIDEKNNTVQLTDKGIEYLSKTLNKPKMFLLPDINKKIKNIKNKYSIEDKNYIKKKIKQVFIDISIQADRIHKVQQLLKANTLLDINIDYVVINNKIKIIDQQTGRIMKSRRYSDGLHQALEAKENLNIEDSTQTLAMITLQNYFRMYSKLSGMTGTATTEAKEFWDIYNLDVVIIPRKKTLIRKDFEDLVYKNLKEKYKAIIDDVINISKNKKRPVLVGTKSVKISELISDMLKANNISHNVLNAKLHKKEAEIINNAGSLGMITIATNMAGRGTDIKITKEVKQNGGLAIIGTERHDSRRIDLQLRGRSGRQGDPGTSQFYISLEDNLIRLFVRSDQLSLLIDKFRDKKGDPIQHYLITKSIEKAQKKIEENNFEIRKRLLEYDDVMNQQRKIIYNLRKNTLKKYKIKINIINMINYILKKYLKLHDEKIIKKKLYYMFKYKLESSNKELKKKSTIPNINILSSKILNHYEDSNQKIIDLIDLNSIKIKLFDFNEYIHLTDNKNKITIQYDPKYSKNKIINIIEKKITLLILDKKWKNHLKEMDNLRQSVQNYIYEQKDPLLIYQEEGFLIFKKLIKNIFHEIIYFLFNYKLINL